MKHQQESLRQQHPVPQNIMEVEFKLIGDMTVRQFGYVAGGAILCYIIYSQNLPSVIRWPFIAFAGLGALGLAFLPMEDRGMDQWVKNFFAACYSPTQRAWKTTPNQRPIAKKETKQIKKSKGEQISTEEWKKENRHLRQQLTKLGKEYQQIKKQVAGKKIAADMEKTVSFYQNQLETAQEKNKALEEDLKQKKEAYEQEKKSLQLEEYQKQIEYLKKSNKKLNQQVTEASKKAKTLEQDIAKLDRQNEAYAQELTAKERELKKLEDERNKAVGRMLKLSKKSQTRASRQTAPKKPSKKPSDHAPKSPPQTPIIKDIPNIINGFVKDKEGKIFSGALVIIKDKDGDPVRALKTNKLGQFSVSTPLPNGSYTVKVNNGEAFSPVEVALDGSILSPIVFKEQRDS